MTMKIKHLLLTACITCAFAFNNQRSYAQQSMIGDISYPYLEKLISTAKENYPRMKYFEGRAQVAENNITKQKLSWFDSFTFSYVYQPNNTLNLVNPNFFNGYQLGVFLNFGSLFRTPFNVKQAKQELKISESELEEYKLNIEAEVKKRYFTYIQAVNILKVENQAALDAQSLLKDIRYRYEKSEVTLEEYNNALIMVSTHNKSKLQAESELLTAKSSLEELLGTKLEEVK